MILQLKKSVENFWIFNPRTSTFDFKMPFLDLGSCVVGLAISYVFRLLTPKSGAFAFFCTILVSIALLVRNYSSFAAIVASIGGGVCTRNSVCHNLSSVALRQVLLQLVHFTWIYFVAAFYGR